MPLLGVHNSIAGGLTRALDIGVALRCECMQMFVRNQRQWRAPPLTDADVAAWRTARARTDIAPVAVHDSYLINLACPDRTIRDRSIDAFADELGRCNRLGVEYLVMHPGAHLGAGEQAGLNMLVESLDCVLADQPGGPTVVLLELTAGQGTGLGWRFEQLAYVLEHAAEPGRLGVCVDTCHAFAAGYDLRAPESVAATLDELDRVVGLSHLRAMHVNDSKRELGSRVDRHEHIGRGHIGDRGFWSLLHEPRLAAIPMILETPKGEQGDRLEHDRRNLARLRRLVKMNRMPAKA